MSDSAVVTPPTVIPETVTLDSELVIETLAAMCAISSVFEVLDLEDGEAAAWIYKHVRKLEETSFNPEGAPLEDDDPLVVAVTARHDELTAEVMGFFDELRSKVPGYLRSARKIRENGTIA